MMRNAALVSLPLVFLLITCLKGQTPRAVASSTSSATSLQVHTDGRVTFRIAAPKATTVDLSGDWLEPDAPTTSPLTKDDQGIWSVTVGPLHPDDYLYWFTVDGVHTPDPGNPTVQPGTHTVQNILHISGPGIEFAENQPVPHGEIRQVRYISSVTSAARRMHVYTPPGYETGTSRFPVLYLLHGGGGDDSSWTAIGRAGFILDNLLAAKKAQPMIVVMPDLNKPRPDGVRAVGVFIAQTDDFTNELMRDILPIVERNYRVLPGTHNRAVAGGAVGGYTTLHLLAHKMRYFGEFGIWSAPVEGKTVAEAKTRYAPLFDHPEAVKQGGKRVWICVGEKDAGAASVRALAELLEKQGIPHALRVSGGGHRWSPWRRYLYEFAQGMFVQSRH